MTWLLKIIHRDCCEQFHVQTISLDWTSHTNRIAVQREAGNVGNVTAKLRGTPLMCTSHAVMNCPLKTNHYSEHSFFFIFFLHVLNKKNREKFMSDEYI